MNFPFENSMDPNSKPRRYAHDLWLYGNGRVADGRPRYLQLQFFIYKKVGAKAAKIDSISAYDLTPDRGDTSDRLGFNGS